MRSLHVFGGALILATAMSAHAATLTVTTDDDEANCRNETGCSVAAALSYPNSTGCSLREALQDIADIAGGQPLEYPECGTPDPGPPPGSNTIVLGAHAIVLFKPVKDPNDSTGTDFVTNGLLPFITNKTTAGTLTITGGAVSCQYDPNASPPIGGNSMFTTANGASVTFEGTSFSNCTAPADGVAIVNSGNSDGDLNLVGTTFTNIHGINQGNGGCIAHGNGNLTITGGSFTACIVDDGGVVPGGGNGNGGAIYITNAGGTSRVVISGVTFQANIAGSNGGAIYMSGTDAIAIDTSAFQANIAAGNTSRTVNTNAELGGGAIYATGTASNGNDGQTQGIFASAFLIFQTSFIGNTAPVGTGGAILLTGSGKLTYGTLALNFDDYSTGIVGSIPGGIIASNFSANVAGGSWDLQNGALDPRAGSGGAIYASGYLSVLASSFVGANTSTNANGGAIAYHDAGDSFTPLAIANVTFSGNSAGTNGGAIANFADKNTSNSGKVVLINATIDGNSATGAGGGFFNANTTASEFHVANSIISNNTGASGANCGGQAFTDDGGNVQFNPDATCGAAKVGDPLLAGAAPFGGVNALVAVMKLGDTSAAQGAGVESICDLAPIKDFDAALNGRPSGKPTCDAGAYESASQLPVRLQSFEVE
jgi:predicted outer membrane repeat protein